MKNTDHKAAPENYVERLYAHLAEAGYVPVLRRGNDKLADAPGHFACGEYWRLDNPSMRAIVSLDLVHGNRLTVTCKQAPKISLARRLADRFFARAAVLPDAVITAQELVEGTKTIPGIDQISAAHKRLAQSLHAQVKPTFFVDPLTSNDSVVALIAHVEGDLSKIVAAAGPRPTDEEARLKRLGAIGAQQLIKTSVVSLDVPVSGHDMLCLTARRMVMRCYQSQPQHVGFDQFINNHAVLIDQHARRCQSAHALQTPMPIR